MVMDSDQIDKLTIKFFQRNNNSVNVLSKILQDDIWSVKVRIISFGHQLNRTLLIKSTTGRIISYGKTPET
jgi:hypothetical protein